tara:strand:+ start:362 stop:1153 length:792 start_codon:yes stop_codon:yes gene_type:complete
MHPVIEWMNEQNSKSVEGNYRWYKINKDGEKVPSVTTVLNIIDKGEHFHKWLANHLNYDHACSVRDEAAQRGTDVHDIVETLINNEPVNLENYGKDIIKRIMSFEKWWEDTMPMDIVAVEEVLAYPGIFYAGRFDFIANIKGRNTLIDIKTGGHYKTHDLQATMYKILWDTICEHLGLDQEYMIHDLYGLYLKDSWIKAPNPQFKKLQFRPKEVEAAVTLWRYNNENAYGKVLPPKQKDTLRTKFKLRMDEYENTEKNLDEYL